MNSENNNVKSDRVCWRNTTLQRWPTNSTPW